MDLATLKMFAAVLLEFFKPKIPVWAYAILKSFIDKMVLEFKPVIGDAPDGLKAFVKSFLVAQALLIPYPFVGQVVIRILNALDGVILDYLWDLAQAKLAGGPALMLSAPPIEVTGLDELAVEAAA